MQALEARADDDGFAAPQQVVSFNQSFLGLTRLIAVMKKREGGDGESFAAPQQRVSFNFFFSVWEWLVRQHYFQ